MSFTFLPNRKAVIIYRNPDQKEFEAVLWRIRHAVYARHYIGPLWNTSRAGQNPLGIRWVSGDAEPITFTYTVENKFHSGFSDSSFPRIGTECEATIYLRPSALRFHTMWLHEDPTDPSIIDPILKQLETK